jgi:hypothetical protein
MGVLKSKDVLYANFAQSCNRLGHTHYLLLMYLWAVAIANY